MHRARVSGRGRANVARVDKFLRQRISQHGNLVPDADAPKAAAQREPCRFAGSHDPAQWLAGDRSRREQSTLGGKITRVVEVLRAAKTIGQVIVAEPGE